MKKIISIKKKDKHCFYTKIEKKDIVEKMISNCTNIIASYNSRHDDSIKAKHFENIEVIDKETKQKEKNGGLLIDLYSEDAKKAYKALTTKKNKTFLECSTFIQALFFTALFKSIGEHEKEETKLFCIKPFCTKTKEKFLSFDNFVDVTDFEKKIDAREIYDLEIGDVLYIENYDVYPNEMNGPYSGEWCLVTDDKSKKNPTVFGFGIGFQKYLDVKGILRNACESELIKAKKNVGLINKRDKVGISYRMKLKDFIFL